MNAADIMTGNLQTVRPDEAISVAMDLLSRAEARHLPVVNDEGELLGILSDRDLLALLGRYDEDGARVAEVAASEQAKRAVSEIMTPDVIAVQDDADIEEVVERLIEERVGALPVVDADDKVLGIVSYIDVLRAWQREHGADEVSALLPTTAEVEDRAQTAEGRTVAPRPPTTAGERRPRARKAAGR